MIGISVTIRNNRLEIIKSAIENNTDEYDPGSGHLLIYTGIRPSTGYEFDEYDDFILLVDFILPNPCCSINSGILTFEDIQDTIGLESGTAGWARITDVDDNFIMDLSVSDLLGSGDIKIDSLDISKNGVIHCTIGTITEGNS